MMTGIIAEYGRIVKSKTGVLQKGEPGTGSVRGKIGSERKMVNEELVRDLSLFPLCLGLSTCVLL